MMNIVYFGTPDFASYILKSLVDKGHNIVGVVTNKDKPAGRGHKLRPSSVKEVAMECLPQVPILQPEKLTDEGFISELRALNADLFIVIAFRMLPKTVWSMPKYGTFNLHASLLPKYRGAAPIQYAILNEDRETGVTTFLLNDGIDMGQILLQEAIAIAADETGGSLHDKLMQLGAEVTHRTIKGLADGSLHPKAQPEMGDTSYAHKIFKEDRVLHFTEETAHILALRVRAMSPYPAAIGILGNEEVKVFSVAEVPSLGSKLPGEIVVEGRRMMVQCVEGALELLEVQFPSKKRTHVSDYLLGNTLTEGISFR